MKTLLKIIGVIILLIIVAGFVLPIIFKDDIITKVKTEANKNLNAKVDFGDFNLSLFKSFPDFTLSMENVSVAGVDKFEGDTLARIGNFEVTVDIMSVINGEKVSVESFGLEDARIHAIVLQDSTANWDIAKASGEEEAPEEPQSEEGGDFHVALNNYYIKNTHIIYDDRLGNMYAEIRNLNHEGRGDFTQDIFTLETETTADAMTYASEGMKFLNKAKLDMVFNIEMNMPESKYTFKENEIGINALALGFAGWVAMPDDEKIEMDLKFDTKKTDFKALLSMVPAVYARDFEDVKTEGKLVLNGQAKGTYTETSLPSFALTLLVENARFQYPDLPKSAENINIDVKVTNSGGSEDNTVIDISQFHVELADNPIDVKMLVKTPVSDPNINGIIQAQMNLASLQDVIPTEEGESYNGSITADITLAGKMSAIEQSRYGDFTAKGKLIVLDMDYQSPDLPYGVNIRKMYMDFAPQYVDLTTFESNIGKSDISMKGKINNMLAYYFNDDPLQGRFSMSSKLMDLNEFMGEEEEAEGTGGTEGEGEEEPMEVIEVPGNLDFVLNAQIDKLLYDNMEMTNVSGGVVIRDKKVILDDLSMNTMGGNLSLDGSYATVDPKQPEVHFDMNIRNFDIPQTYKTFNTVQQMAPVAEKATGSFSAKVDFNGMLDQHMDPVMNSLNGSGKLKTHNVEVENSETLNKIASTIDMNSFKSLYLNDVDISFSFSDGKVNVDPFDFKVGNIAATMGGSNSFDQTMDYVMNLEVPMQALGGTANQAVKGVISQANKAAGTELSAGDKVKMNLLITGPMSDPKITPQFAKGGAADMKEALKDKAKEELQKKKEELEKQAREEAEKMKKEAEEKAKQEVDEAKKKAQEEAERKKKEAEEKARREAEKKKKEAEEKAKEEAKKKAKDLFKRP